MNSDNLFNVKDKTILIVGASSGIGESFANFLMEAGATILVAARRVDKLQSLAASNHKCIAYSVDVTDENSVKELMNKIEQDGFHIDVLVNTAGINIRQPIAEYEFSNWRKVMSTNLDGAWLISQQVAIHMVKNNIEGSVINISSIVSSRTLKVSPPVYAASKAAVEQMTKVMALEFADKNIRFNVLAPGWFITDLNRTLFDSEQGEKIQRSIPMQRAGKIPELYGALLLLASDASRYMTGSVLQIDGGYASNHIVL